MSKGLSQVLGLIITGVVFMTLALTMVALIMDYIPGATEPVDEEACISQIQTYCNTGMEDRLPQACVESDGTLMDLPQYGLDGRNLEDEPWGDADTLECP